MDIQVIPGDVGENDGVQIDPVETTVGQSLGGRLKHQGVHPTPIHIEEQCLQPDRFRNDVGQLKRNAGIANTETADQAY